MKLLVDMASLFCMMFAYVAAAAATRTNTGREGGGGGSEMESPLDSQPYLLLVVINVGLCHFQHHLANGGIVLRPEHGDGMIRP